jgi:drug/metabolite transporter (DMT)-like permease
MGVALAILSSLLIATGNVFLKKSFKDFTPAVSFFFFSIFCLLIWIPFGLNLGFSFENMWLGILAGVISAIFGQLSYIYVISKGELSVTGTILSSYSIYTVVFSYFFNNERLSFTSLIFVILTIIGTLIVCLPEKVDKSDLRRYSNILIAVAGALCIAASDTFSKNVINKTSIGSFLVWVALSQFIISFFFLKEMGESLDQFNRIFKKLNEYKWSLLGAFGASAGTMAFFLSYNYTLASIASPINATYPVLTIILSLIFLKEKISLKNTIGLILVIISVIGVGFYSV